MNYVDLVKKKKLKIKEIAKKAGVDRGTVYNFLNGKNITENTANAIRKVLGDVGIESDKGILMEEEIKKMRIILENKRAANLLRSFLDSLLAFVITERESSGHPPKPGQEESPPTLNHS